MTGEPTHFELGVADANRANEFYTRLFGWQLHQMGGGAEGWIETGGVRGGLHENDPNPGVVVYFDVQDIESALELVEQLGGEPGQPSPEEPGFGRFAECRDDHPVRPAPAELNANLVRRDFPCSPLVGFDVPCSSY